MNKTNQARAESALKLAIARCHGVNAMAEKLGITHSAVSQWTICPTPRCLEVEKLSGVPRYDLRPDIYPQEKDTAHDPSNT